MSRLALVFLLAGCVGGGPADSGGDADTTPLAEEPPALRDYALDDPAYRFCHEYGPFSEDTRPWCDLQDAVPLDRCPGFHELCAADPSDDVPTPMGGCGSPPPVGPGGLPAGAPEAPSGADETDWTQPVSCDPPETSLGWLSVVLKWLGAALVALLVLVVLRVIVWAVMRARSVAQEPAEELPAAPVLTAEDAEDEVPDLPSDDLLAAAERAVSEERWHDAVYLARAASLRHLHQQGELRLQRWRTDREYLRATRRNASVHGPLGAVLRAVESLRWGGTVADAEQARAVLSAARKLVGVAVVFALLVLAGGADVDYRFGPQGDTAVADLLRGQGFDVSWRLRSLASLDDDTDMLLLDLSGVEPSESDWEGVRTWVEAGGVLLVTGDAELGLPELGESVIVDPYEPASRLEVGLPETPGWPKYGWIDGQTYGLVSDQTSGAVLVGSLKLGQGQVYAVRDHQLLWNAALLLPVNEELVGQLVELGRSTVVMEDPADVSVQLALTAAGGSDNPIETLWNAQLLPFLLQLLLTMGLAALALGWPFAPLRDPEAADQEHFVDHITALGARYRRLGAVDFVTAAYARWALGRYGVAGLTSRLQRGGLSEAEARQRLDRVRDLAEGRASAQHIKELEELWKTTHRE